MRWNENLGVKGWNENLGVKGYKISYLVVRHGNLGGMGTGSLRVQLPSF